MLNVKLTLQESKPLLIMRPHPKHSDNFGVFKNFINQPVLNVDSGGVEA